MAERRMFTKKITDSDAFIELPSSAQSLYFHLNQGADDDGFNNQVQNAMFKSHSTIDDLKILMLKNFIIRFESGVIVIKHWRMHNTLRKDRYTPTNFQEEIKLLGIKENGAYTFLSNGCQVVANGLPQDSIGKNSTDKISIDKENIINEHLTTSKISKKEFEKQYIQEFENIWKYYPNKKGKEQALKKYILARNQGTSYEAIAQGLKKYINYIKSENIEEKYIKHGSTWFNQKCWNDDYKISNKKSQNDEQWELLKGVYDGTIKIK